MKLWRRIDPVEEDRRTRAAEDVLRQHELQVARLEAALALADERAMAAEARADHAYRELLDIARGPQQYISEATTTPDLPPGFWSEDGLVYIETEDDSE